MSAYNSFLAHEQELSPLAQTDELSVQEDARGGTAGRVDRWLAVAEAADLKEVKLQGSRSGAEPDSLRRSRADHSVRTVGQATV